MSRVLVAITGASGAIYGVRLTQRLMDSGIDTEVILSDAARRILAVEHDIEGDPSAILADSRGQVPVLHDIRDIGAPPASGSTAPDAMIVAPCSMGTAGRIAAGVSTTLVERAADVMLKERRPLVIVPRETPLSTLHLRNLLALSEMGVAVVPASPAFYFHPEGIEDLVAFIVDRAIACAGLPVEARHRWEPPAGDGAEA
jgi:4-hydroxy-3-polyprenylbenzoate decarboxylase